jgi:hypothetical protein
MTGPVAVPRAGVAELGIFCFIALDQLQDLKGRVLFQGIGEETIKALCAATAIHAGLGHLGRRQGAFRRERCFLVRMPQYLAPIESNRQSTV